MGSACFYILLVTFYVFLVNCGAQEEAICPFESIYQFGDSISDTGNFIHIIGGASPSACFPYGETFLHRPTGRFFDGLLVIDFIAVALHLLLLNPYLDRNASFEYGANFIVAGSTALDTSFLAARGIQTPLFNTPFSFQLNCFRTLLNFMSHTRALLFVGEIGGNEINYALIQGKSIQEIQSYVPFIVGGNCRCC